jgi:hypothetical protein
MPKKPKETKETEPDRWPVAHKLFFCLNPNCPDARWHECAGRELRLMDADHFTEDGMCKHRKEEPDG